MLTFLKFEKLVIISFLMLELAYIRRITQMDDEIYEYSLHTNAYM